MIPQLLTKPFSDTFSPTDLADSGQLQYCPNFLSAAESDFYFATLQHELSWHEESIRMFGQLIQVPRLICWYGDENANYKYSAIDHKPLIWTTTLLNLRQKLHQFTPFHFNSVLGNFYRHGRDSMGWHADNEKELGMRPTIASISLGAARQFKMRRKDKSQSMVLELEHGSLLLMSGDLQQHWEHSVPKTRLRMGPRINLTFRNILLPEKR